MFCEVKAERGGPIHDQNGERRIFKRLYEAFRRNNPPTRGRKHGFSNAGHETAVRPDWQFFRSIGYETEELFERVNKYFAYEDDLAMASKPIMAIGDGTMRSGRTSS